MARTSKSLTVGPKGQVVIPKDVRDRVNIRPGDQVVVEAADGEARVRPVALGVGDLRGLIPRSANGMADWDEEKRRERQLEDERDARRSHGGTDR